MPECRGAREAGEPEAGAGRRPEARRHNEASPVGPGALQRHGGRHAGGGGKWQLSPDYTHFANYHTHARPRRQPAPLRARQRDGGSLGAQGGRGGAVCPAWVPIARPRAVGGGASRDRRRSRRFATASATSSIMLPSLAGALTARPDYEPHYYHYRTTYSQRIASPA